MMKRASQYICLLGGMMGLTVAGFVTSSSAQELNQARKDQLAAFFQQCNQPGEVQVPEGCGFFLDGVRYVREVENPSVESRQRQSAPGNLYGHLDSYWSGRVAHYPCPTDVDGCEALSLIPTPSSVYEVLPPSFYSGLETYLQSQQPSADRSEILREAFVDRRSFGLLLPDQTWEDFVDANPDVNELSPQEVVNALQEYDRETPVPALVYPSRSWRDVFSDRANRDFIDYTTQLPPGFWEAPPAQGVQ